MPDTSSDKLVKKVCTAKKGGPKPKYLDPIIALTQTNNAAIPDLCASLARQLREPNVTIVFKALLVVHNMMRSGGTDAVLEHLAKMDVLRLKSVGQGSVWEGYQHSSTLTHYAHYLHARITAFRTLKHDMVRVQAESNRASAYRTQTEGASERARKLRSLTVERGLLRETREVQRIIDTLVKCTFYRDDLHDECTVLAFRMLTKDLLVLFQAGNEGIINLLEHYFEMSHADASDALALYKAFCAQTKKVVEYLRFAKDLNNIIDVPIPNLKHAPVSLVAALEEYIEDPNFEQNREEYKNNKDIADGKVKAPAAAQSSAAVAKAPSPVAPSKPSAAPTAAASSSAAGPSTNGGAPQQQSVVDFFSSIEDNQNSMFNPQPNSPTSAFLQQQAAVNPFAARMMLQQQQTMFAQPAGFGQMQPQMQPQMTGYNPFGAMQHPQQQPQAQFLQPQATGYNPFRQSVMPQMTGFPGMQQQQQQPIQQQQPMQAPQQQQQQQQAASGFDQQFASIFDPSSAPQPPSQQQRQPQASAFNFDDQFASIFNAPAQAQQPQQQQQQASAFGGGFSGANGFSSQAPPAQLQPQPTGTNPFTRSQSVPLVAQPTGSKNPFGAAPAPAQPKTTDAVGKGPSLMDLAFGNAQQQQQQQQQQSQQPGAMSSLASDFAFGRASSTGDASSSSAAGQGLSSFQPDAGRAAMSASPQPLQPQRTGFAGSSVQPFKPSSSFGASLLSSLPETSASPSGLQPQATGLQPQLTGLPNPFRSSTLPTSFRPSPGLPSQSTGQSSGLGAQSTGASSFGASLFGTTTGATSLSLATPTSQFGAIQPQATGMRAPFQPSSNFGQELQATKTVGADGGGFNPFQRWA